MTLPLDSFDLLAAPDDLLAGAPLKLPIASVSEDPDQPRHEFDLGRLAELAASIKERGVLQPISVRRHPEQSDRWMMNFGARRLRASKLAGKADIPAYVDNTADSYDQIVENEQREGLKPLELALFVQRRLAAGETQAEIARRMGKSRQYVTLATALIDPPDWLIAAYREGRCRGLNELYELRKLAADRPEYVEAWTSGRDAITRDQVATLRAELAHGSESGRSSTSPSIHPLAKGDEKGSRQEEAALAPAPPSAASQRQTSPRLKLLAKLDDATVVVDTRSVPSQAGHIFVRAVGSRETEAVDAKRLVLTGFAAMGLSI